MVTRFLTFAMVGATALLVAGCVNGFKTETTPPQLVKRVEAPYPPQAKADGIEGRVIFEFTVNEDGIPVDYMIVESTPPGVFDAVALNALSRWRYQPAMRNGKAVPSPEAEAVFIFEVERQ